MAILATLWSAVDGRAGTRGQQVQGCNARGRIFLLGWSYRTLLGYVNYHVDLLCCYLAMEMINTNLERGISGMMGGILATRGATWALLMGVLFYLALAYGTDLKTLKK